MKYYYTNKNGEKVYVDKDHLDTALQIKRQLQMESPSHRVNWRKHKQMMEKEGFFDSEASESYRMLIRNYETRVVQDSYEIENEEIEEQKNPQKLESIKEIVGDLYYTKKEIQLENQKLNKFKKDITLYGIIAEEISKSIEKINIRVYEQSSVDIPDTEREIVVLPSDTHVGYLDDNFDFNVAQDRMDKYADKVLEYAKLFGVKVFHIAHMGDAIEHLYMHKNTQAYNSEFTLAEQIVKAVELMFNFISKLSSNNIVYYKGTVEGNHGRSSNKGETVPHDCAEYIIHEMLKSIIKKTNMKNVVIDDDGYNIERCLFEVKGKTFLITHGHKDNQNDKMIIQKYISSENRLIDVLCRGHFHNYGVFTENHGRIIYQSGCLQGANDYSKSLKFNNLPSQGIIVVSENEIIPININLQN